MDSVVDHALKYASEGLAVFPVKPRSKQPATANGFKDASNDPETVRSLFARKRSCNIGIATGPVSGLWVLDVDGSAGIKALADIETEHGKFPETTVSRTGGGGFQYFWRLNGEPIKNRTKIGGDRIDVRGDGGYVVAPPSRHPSGNLYEWVSKGNLAEAPAWLVDIVLDRDSADLSLAFTIGGNLDLGSDPGASKGERHTRALKLIGSEIGKGTDPVEVARLATDWADRCSPPLGHEDVLKILQGLSRRDGAKVEADEIDRLELPPAPAWPEIDQAAYYGLVGDLVCKIEPQSEADPAGLLAQIVVSFGNLIGRSAHYIVEGTPHYTNLFAVLVGATAKGRKGTSEGRVRSFFRDVDEEWSRDRIVTGLVSGEGLVWNVRDPIYKTEAIKEKGKIVRYQEVLDDPGVEDKRLLVVEPEFGAVLRVCRRETNILSPTIRSAWDSGNLRTLAKNSPARATGAHISIVGHITKEELERTLSEVENFSGFSNRFCWLLVRRSKLLPDGGQDLDLTESVRGIGTSIKYARTVARMRRDAKATELWREIYRELSHASGRLVGAVTSRGEAQVLRLSMIYALLDLSETIHKEHLAAALALWRYCQRSAEIIFGSSTGDPIADRLLQFIKDEPGISRRDLRRKFSTSEKSQAIVKALGRLETLGLAYRKIEKKTKPSERWFPGSEPNANAKSPRDGKELADLALAQDTNGEMEEFTI